MSSRTKRDPRDSIRTYSKNPRHSSKPIFRASVFLLTLLPFITLNATTWVADAADSPRLGGACVSELQWTSPGYENTPVQLICLKTAQGLKWQDPGKVKVDAHLNSILIKCGEQLSQIDMAKVNAKLLSSFKLAINQYISTVLHLRVVRIETSTGFFNLSVKYYRQVGMCSGGVASYASYVGPDTRIPANSTLLWEAFTYCQIGPQTAPLDLAFARVGNSWKFVALGGITSQPVYQ